MSTREILKNPDVPKLSDETIKLITKLCFSTDDKLKPVDIIFIFGGAEPDYVRQLEKIIPELVEQKISKKIIVTGGRPNYDERGKDSQSEAQMLIDRLQKMVNNSEVEFIKENDSRNIMENVKNALPVLEKINSILFISKSHVARRAYLTFQKYLPNVEILQKSCDVIYQVSDKKISKNSWDKFAFGRSRVWGEYMRIKRYGQREMIEFDEVEELVNKIEESAK